MIKSANATLTITGMLVKNFLKGLRYQMGNWSGREMIYVLTGLVIRRTRAALPGLIEMSVIR